MASFDKFVQGDNAQTIMQLLAEGMQGMAILLNRMLRAALLDSALYEEVEADQRATGQAVAVVVLASLAAGIGGGLREGLLSIIIQALVQVVVWYGWAYLTYFIGTKLLPEDTTQADHGELLRTIGFSSAPGVIRVLGIVPGLYEILLFIASIWMLVTMIIAVRQALDYSSTIRAIGVCVIGWAVMLVILLLFVGPAETAWFSR